MSSAPTTLSSEELVAKLQSLYKDRSQVDHIAATFELRPFRGSCHCKLIQYIVWLNIPTAATQKDVDIAEFEAASRQEIYRCNCTTCQKLGLFHWRFKDAPKKFALLTPVDENGLVLEEHGKPGVRNYQCYTKKNNWWFCGSCGVRCFSTGGDFEVANISLPAKLLEGVDGVHIVSEESEGEDNNKTVRVWRAKEETWEKKPRSSYLSVNATSIDAKQDGADLRELHERGWIGYFEALDETRQLGIKPFLGGLY